MVAGTGSSVVAQAAGGQTLLAGGRGAVFGDDGGAYALAVAGLRAAADAIDGIGPNTALAAALLAGAKLAQFSELPAWTLNASKREIASLARVVLDCASQGDALAKQCADEQAERLAAQAAAAHRRLALPPNTPFLLHGGLFEHAPEYRDAFTHALERLMPNAAIRVPGLRGHRAAAELARTAELPGWFLGSAARRGDLPEKSELPPTEMRATSHPPLDRLSALEIVHAMNREDHRAVEAVAHEANIIAKVIERVAAAFRAGGRLIYMGAGTSGRLGVLDASECPPTFGVPPELVIGMIAGGDNALRKSIEGAEDNPAEAVASIEALSPPIGPNDVLVGIAASGTTPYVLGALAYAEARGAEPVLLCCNPAQRGAARMVIALDTGPEALTGSTRLKAGTATKLVLNMITTGAMARSGYIYEGLMVRVRPVNAKLRQRAARITATLAGMDEETAGALLERADGEIGVAVLMALRRLSVEDATERFARCGYDLRAALDVL